MQVKTNLMALLNVFKHFVVAHFIHVSHCSHPVDSFDANERLRQGNWAKPAVKEEQALIRIHTKKSGDIQVVG